MKDFKWIIKTTDGDTLQLPQRDVQRTLDRRGSWEKPQVVFEVSVRGVVRRLWPEDVVSVFQVEA